tara:strand:+ start:22157 stop:24169 length:2013 start_codon:yes stop_codon:yes gene_type:complete
MSSTIIIKFNSPASVGDILQIQDSNTPSVLIDIQFDTTSFSIPVTGDKTQDVSNVVNLINNNYNATGRYKVTSNYVTYEIEVLDQIGNSEFTVVQNNTSGDITTTIDNTPVIDVLRIDNISLSENGSNPCGLFDLTITTNIQATEITKPVVQAVNTNPFTITGISRDSIDNILISVNDGVSIDSDSIYVPITNSAAFKLDVFNNPSGGAVNVSLLNGKTADFNYQYSLDDVNYYNSSSFSGLDEGSYTIYIKDSLGCSTSLDFEIEEFTPNFFDRDAFFEVSEQNSLITVKREVIDEVSIFKNPTNTLSYEEESDINRKNFKQLFQKKDGIITQQYKSNYSNVLINLVDCDGNESEIIPEQKTENFNITDVRDVSLLPVNYLGSSFVGVQYKVGNTYNPDTLTVNGSYNLGSDLPDFMNVEDYIQIEGAGWYKVTNIDYYDGIETLVIESTVAGFPIELNQTVRGTSVYDVLDYEVYEFSLDLSTLEGDYYITYSANDLNYDSVNFISEWFNVSDVQFRTYLLQYYNSENNETNYSTGIINKIRIPYDISLTYLPNDTQDVYLTDTNAVNIESTYRDLYSLECRNVPLGMVRKMGLAVSNDRLFLNGLSLLKNSELEVERIGTSNVYKTTIQFVRSDYAFTNISSDGSIVLPTGTPIKISGSGKGLLLTK